jgi:hypothetical protein
LKTADGNEKQSIETMRKYENQSKQKFAKNACMDLGNQSASELTIAKADIEKPTSWRILNKCVGLKLKR